MYFKQNSVLTLMFNPPKLSRPRPRPRGRVRGQFFESKYRNRNTNVNKNAQYITASRHLVTERIEYKLLWPIVVTLLIAQALATAAYRLFGFDGDTVGLHSGNFFENVIFFVTTTRIDIKPSRYFAHGLYESACKISPSYDTAFRRR